MRHQNLFEALQNVCGFTALQAEMFEIIEAYEKDKQTLTEEEFKRRCAEIILENITFSGQLNDYLIHGALDELWKLFLELKAPIN